MTTDLTNAYKILDDLNAANTTSSSFNWTPYIGTGAVGLKYASNPLGALNQDLSKPGYGAMTGAGLGSTIGALAGTGSFAGPIGTAIGAGIGALAGFIGNKGFGLGKTKKVGSEVLGGTYYTPGNMTPVSKDRYDAYNQAMNYLNSYNIANNTGVAPVGASQYGQDVYKTKRIGHNKKSYAPWYAINTNTGYGPLDDLTRSGMNWDTYNSYQGDIYGGRYNYLADKAAVNPDVDVWGLARAENNKQLGNAQDTLRSGLIRGYLDNASYNRALKELTGNSNTNMLGLVDIGNNQLDQWKSDARQAYEKNMNPGDWVGNYEGWKKDEFNIPEYNVNVDEGFLSRLMRDGNQYLPYQAMNTGIGNKGFSGGYNNWLNNRRA